MAKKDLYVLTTNFPYGLGETFLETESQFLSQCFDRVHYIPLWKETGFRQLPSNSVVEDPLLGFNPKGNVRLVLKGVFCTSPLFFAIPLFFREKAWKGKKMFWDFMTSLLLIRACYSSVKKLDLKRSLVYSYWGDKSALLLPLLKQKFGVIGVARFHGTDLYEEACGGYKPLRKWLFQSLDMAMPISEDGKRYLEARYGMDAPRRIEVHRLGVFNRGLNPEAEGAEFQLVSCSNIVPVKRVALLAEAIGLLGFKTHWVHIGNGPLLGEVEAVAASFPQNITVAFLGAMPNVQVLDYYAHHHVDLFVNVSESEGVPVSIMEALSFGIPIVATEVGGVSEIVDDAVGKLVPADVLARQICEAITSCKDGELTTMRANARKRWAERCDAQENYGKFCELLASM